MTLPQYVSEIVKYPLLTENQELTILRAINGVLSKNDREFFAQVIENYGTPTKKPKEWAKEVLVLSNMRYPFSVATFLAANSNCREQDTMDYTQEGIRGLYASVKNMT